MKTVSAPVRARPYARGASGKAAMGELMVICSDLLEKTCKNMIQTILACLENAVKGTIYRVGPMVDLRTVRISSGARKPGSDEIEWGLPAVSDYNYPGKSWIEYRDRPNHVLEAMGWCIERQQCWTASNPYEDVRSVGKQLRGEIEDCYHMEPVLVRKRDIYGRKTGLEYPVDWRGNPIWRDSEYIVGAVVKIHFMPGTLQMADRSTKVIKELSRSLGTELLSLHFRDTLFQAQKALTRQRIRSCEVLAHGLRNTIMKFSFVFSAINSETGILREEWERRIRNALPALDSKAELLGMLGEILRSRLPLPQGAEKWSKLAEKMIREQEELARMPVLPAQGERWIENKIKPKWEMLLGAVDAWDAQKLEVLDLLARLKKSLWIGVNADLMENVSGIAHETKQTWARLAYTDLTVGNLSVLDEILDFLDDPAPVIPFSYSLKKTLKSLKALAEILPEVERRANEIILYLRNGSSMEPDAGSIEDFPEESPEVCEPSDQQTIDSRYGTEFV